VCSVSTTSTTPVAEDIPGVGVAALPRAMA
jgi:hypothetical protein